MITARNCLPDFRTDFTDGIHSAIADTGKKDGGGDLGFHPHDLLEAAIASCMNMTVRMYAARHGMRLTSVAVRVMLDRSKPGEAIFRSDVELEGELTDLQRSKLRHIAAACPVRRTLMRTIRFEEES
jgi:putative redox protein